MILARSDDGGTDGVGVALAFGGLLAITLASLYENRFGTEQHPVSANLVQFSVALVATAIPAALLEDLHVEWTGELYVSLAYLVFFNSLLAITLLLTMMRRGTASQVSALFFLVPPLRGAHRVDRARRVAAGRRLARDGARRRGRRDRDPALASQLS